MHHKHLDQQVRSHLPDELLEREDLKVFLKSINDSYNSFERELGELDHARQLCKKEMAIVSRKLKSLEDQQADLLEILGETAAILLPDNEVTDEADSLVRLTEKLRDQVKQEKITQGELSRNISIFKTLLAKLQSGVLIENEHREVLFTNQLFCTLFHIPAPPDQLVGMDCSDAAQQSMHLFKDPQKFVERIDVLLRDRRPVYDEVVETVDGKILRRDYVPIYIDGVYNGHFWKYKDVTAKLHFQKTLQESEERNRLVMNSSLDAIMIADDDGKIQYWNPRAEQVLGWTREEAMGLDMSKLFSSNHGQTIYDRGNYDSRTYLKRMVNRELELTAVNKSGDEFPIELAVVDYQQHGRQYFCGFLKDISTRKHAENLLKEQEEKYRNIITNMNLGLLELDMDGIVLFANQRFCDNSGYELEELVGTKPGTFLLSEEENLEIEQRYQLRTEDFYDSFELAVRNKAGEERWWFLTYTQNFNDDGELIGSVGVHLDITQQKELEAELDKAKTRAEQGSVAKEAFLANMSHEIRTPLNAIIGMIRELSRDQLSPKQETYLGHMDSATRHLLSIVNSILDMSKIEAGELKLDEHNFSLQSLIANVGSILNIKASRKGVRFTSSVDENIWLAFVGDSVRVRQILINLVDNAIKFTLEGSVSLHVEMIEEKGNEQLLAISVTDTGIGMDEEYMEQLFSKFSQAEKSTSRRFGGTGLGMSITKEIIGMMGGTIDVHSRKGEGTVIKIHLRLTKGDVHELSERTHDTKGLLRGAEVLLVEDNLMNRFIAKKSLSYFGCITDEAENGVVALEMLKNKRYDVILMDIQMPKLDGVQTTMIIRNELKLEVPIIAVTANAFKKEIGLYLNIGMNDYVTKPFDEKDLYDTIARQLRWQPPVEIKTIPTCEEDCDFTQLRKLSRGDEDFVDTMIDVFIEHTPPAIQHLNEALQENNYEGVAKVAHRIKPSIESMGVRLLDGVARDIELTAKAETIDANRLTQKVGFLSETLLQVIERLKANRP